MTSTTPVYPITFPLASVSASSGSSEALATLTRPTPVVWVLRLHNGEDNRLTANVFQNVLMPALDAVERDWRTSWRAAKKGKGGLRVEGGGALVITGTGDKFFSNGFHFEETLTIPGFMPNVFNPVIKRLFTFPIPTIAALNGHTFAAGFLIALACDYRVMTTGKAWACMNEVQFGAPLPRLFGALLKGKIGHAHPAILRRVALEGYRFTPQELFKAGIIDHIVDGGHEAILKKSIELGTEISPNARQGVWGLIRSEINQDIMVAADQDVRPIFAEEADAIAKAKL